MKAVRPPMEAEISSELLKFIRNVIAHLPFFEAWDDVWLNRGTANWQTSGGTIDRFLRRYEGRKQVKYRFWEQEKKCMTYLSVCFPENYSKGEKVYLKDILSEKDGARFALILMKRVLDTQIEQSKQSASFDGA